MQLFEVRLVASGEVRDADGNLLSTEPIEATAIVTEQQLAELSALSHTEGETP